MRRGTRYAVLGIALRDWRLSLWLGPWCRVHVLGRSILRCGAGYAFCWWLVVPLGGIWDVAKVRRAGYAMLCYAMPSQQAGKDCDGVQPLSLMAGAGAIVIIILSSRRAIEQRTSSCVPYGLASQADNRYTGRYITTYRHQLTHSSSPTRSPSVPIALSISPKKKSDTVAPNPETI